MDDPFRIFRHYSYYYLQSHLLMNYFLLAHSHYYLTYSIKRLQSLKKKPLYLSKSFDIKDIDLQILGVQTFAN